MTLEPLLSRGGNFRGVGRRQVRMMASGRPEPARFDEYAEMSAAGSGLLVFPRLSSQVLLIL